MLISVAFLWEFLPYGMLFLDLEAMEKYKMSRYPLIFHFAKSERGSEV